MINILNVYDTRYGNTQEIAYLIEDILSASENCMIKTVEVSYVKSGDIKSSDFFIIGSPTHFWKPTHNMKKFVVKLSREKHRNGYACCYGTKIADRLNRGSGKSLYIYLKALGFKLVTPWIDFYVEGYKGPLCKGEIEKCRNFSLYLQKYLFDYQIIR